MARIVIRELAENPNVHQIHAPGYELHRDPDDRFAIYLAPGPCPRRPRSSACA